LGRGREKIFSAGDLVEMHHPNSPVPIRARIAFRTGVENQQAFIDEETLLTMGVEMGDTIEILNISSPIVL
jgi:NADH dehydrogenase FAD-containing subunit